MNVGIVSQWHVHAEGYYEELVKSGKGTPVVLWEESPEKGKEHAAKLNIPLELDYDAFLKTPGLDAILCCSPTTMHPELLIKAAKAGKHIFTEKLLATNTEDCEKIVNAVEKAGVTFTISLPLCTSGISLYVRDLIQSGALGRVGGARFRRSHTGVSENWLPEYWFTLSQTGGGAMMDLGAHPAYILPFLLGTPKRIAGITTNMYGTSSDENAAAVIEFEDGAIGLAETSFVSFGTPDLLEVYGTDGSVYCSGHEVKLCTRETDRKMRVVDPSELPANRPTTLIQFLDAVEQKKPYPEFLGPRDALLLTRIVEGVYRSDKQALAL
jgi:predicted dehydrogenase